MDTHGSCSARRRSPSHDEGLENAGEPSLAAGQIACGCHLLGDRAGSPRGGAADTRCSQPLGPVSIAAVRAGNYICSGDTTSEY